MKLSLYTTRAAGLDLSPICEGLNRVSTTLKVRNGGEVDAFRIDLIRNPATYRGLPATYLEESEADDFSMIFTDEPYENNFFWDSPDPKRVITSLYGWPYLTNLPKNNGVVLFVCALLLRHLRIGHSHYEQNTGCLNDFWRDKSGVDTAMRSAYVCAACLVKTPPKARKSSAALIDDLQRVLDQLSAASRANVDICDSWRGPATKTEFDVFLCHNSLDKPSVRSLNRALKQRGIRTWLDEEQLPPGRPWQDLLEKQISSVASAVVLVGDSGLGPWQNTESRAFLSEFVNRQCPVIPVILRGCTQVPTLPLFLSQHTWVDFRRRTPDPLKRLLWGITGKAPQ